MAFLDQQSNVTSEPRRGRSDMLSSLSGPDLANVNLMVWELLIYFKIDRFQTNI